MTPDGPGPELEWEAIKEIVADALEREPAERSAFVETVCGGDATLHAEVASLLRDTQNSAGFLEEPAATIFDVPAPEPGSHIGQYTLRSVIGEGGMGRVYEATQDRPHRTVALKVLRPGFLSPGAERRFQWEVEALGRLNHPSIAQVHDAGVEEMPSGHALSWFAMEKVDGRPLLEAADALGLDRDARLTLFLRICDGVAHAHQRGIIHRDLKPDNILVDESCAPHLLDFGIARAADPLASSVTMVGEIVGTLAYMSPEQILGEPDRVDARSDVYALGVLLYQLLTGVAPIKFDGLSLPKVALRLTRDDPRPAGEVNRSLRGDLETVLQMALAREADRRYPTVDALAADVRRVLADETITARSPTLWYQFSKFARRNRALVTMAGVALTVLLVGLVGTSLGFVRADAARVRAEIDRDRARDANTFLKSLFASARPDIDGRDVRVVDLLDEATLELEGATVSDPEVRAGLHLTLGETYRRLGMPLKAKGHLESAIETFEATDGAHAETTLEAGGALAEVYVDLDDIEGATAALRRVREGLAETADAPPWLRMRPLELDALLTGATGDLAGHVEKARAVFEAWQTYFPEGDDSVETARTNLSTALLANGQGADADVLLARGIEVMQDTLGPEHSRVLTMRANRALAAAEIGDRLTALEMFDAIEPAALREWGRLHPKTMALRNNRATVLQGLGRVEEALPIFEERLEVTLEIYGDRHRETLIARNNVSVALIQLERFKDAAEVLEVILNSLDGALGEDDPMIVVRTEMNLAAALSGLGRKDEALVMSASVLTGLEDLVGPGHMQTLISRNNHAILLMESGQTGEAVEAARRNYQLARDEHEDLLYREFPFRMNLGRTLAADGRFEGAAVELLAVEKFLRLDPNTIPKQTERIREVLSETYEAWGKPGEAARWRADG